MELETNLKLSLLAEIYKNLLTEKQQNMLKYFLDNNLSITELALEYKTSRQAVNDLLKRTFKILEEYEKKLMLLSKFENIKENVGNCLELVDDICEDSSKQKFTQTKLELKAKLNSILEVM